MYGLVNRAIEELVCTHFSEEIWKRFAQRRTLTLKHLLAWKPYPNAVTYQLVEAASKILGLLLPEAILKHIWRIFTLYTACRAMAESASKCQAIPCRNFCITRQPACTRWFALP